MKNRQATAADVERVLQLVAQNVPRREIARMINLGRSTVASIIDGWRPTPRRNRGAETNAVRGRIAQRCRVCGGMVFMPCLKCQIERERKLAVVAQAFREMVA